MITMNYAGIAIVIIALLAFIIILIKYPRQKKDSSVDYATALNYLILGDNKKALEKLRETVRIDTENIDAYLQIGDIVRKQGMAERAIKVHRDLTVRRNLSSGQNIAILTSLINDYQTVKKYDRAVEVCNKLIEITKNEIWTIELLLHLYEDANDWEKAFETLKKIQKLNGKRDNKLLALYKVEAGLQLIEESKERDSRLKFREAIKIDRNCSAAYLFLSDSYIREEKFNDALAELKKFISQVPELSYLGFNRIKHILFQIGNYSEVEKILISLLTDNKNNELIRFALADIFERKGELDKAIELCEDALDKNPESLRGKHYLAKFLAGKGANEEALKYALDLNNILLDKNENYFTCKNCRYISKEPKWRCPECKKWDSFLS